MWMSIFVRRTQSIEAVLIRKISIQTSGSHYISKEATFRYRNGQNKYSLFGETMSYIHAYKYLCIYLIGHK